MIKRFGLNISNQSDLIKIWEVDQDIKRLLLADSVLTIYNSNHDVLTVIDHVVSFDASSTILCVCLKYSTAMYSFDLLPIHTFILQMKKVVAGARHFIACDALGRVFGAGSNLHGQLGMNGLNVAEWEVNPTLEGLNVIDIAAGNLFSLFLTDAGIVFACGNNDFGQLGMPMIGFENIGQNIPRPVFESLDGSNMQLAAGSRHSLILVGQTVYGSGWSKYNQLGEKVDQIRGFKHIFDNFSVNKIHAINWETILDVKC